MHRRNTDARLGVHEKVPSYEALDPVSEKARVIVGASSRLAADTLLTLVSGAGYCVTGTADTEREIVEVAVNVECDLAVVDVAGWGTAEVLAICEEVKIAVGVPVLVVCEHVDPDVCRLGCNTGIEGVLVAPVVPEQMMAAIELAIARTSPSTSASGTYALDTHAAASGLAALSAREHEVFLLLARGHRPSEVGHELFISAHTVRKHAKLIFRKLGVHSQIELMRRYFGRMGTR